MALKKHAVALEAEPSFNSAASNDASASARQQHEANEKIFDKNANFTDN